MSESNRLRTVGKDMYVLYEVNSEKPSKDITHATLCVLQSCLTLCHPMHYSPPGSSVPGILQVRVLEWVAVPVSPRVSS